MCLVDMARAGASSELNAALDSGAAVNSRCPMNGSTALIAAAKRGHMDIVKNLVSRNAALSLANDIGDTAVDDAFSGGNLLIAAFLLVYGGKSAHARGWSYLVSSVGLNFISSSAVIRFLAAYTLSSWALLIHSAFRLFRCRKTVHVWQAGGADHRIEYMYEPVVSTISQGFSTHLCDVDRQVGCYDWSCVSPGAWFIWVGVTHVRDVPWIYLRLRGVRTIYYQSEPVDAGQYIRLTSDKVEEIWDYSHKNIDVASEKPGAPVMRYVPPGAHKRSPLVQKESANVKLIFLGHLGPERRKMWDVFSTAEGTQGRMLNISNVWSEPQFEALLREDHSSVFLNLHHTAAAAWTLETVRLSKLLCSRALVLSQSSYPRDEAEFSGMVDFVDWSDIPSEFARLLSMTQRERDELASERFARFSGRFEPGSIFARAGIHERFV